MNGGCLVVSRGSCLFVCYHVCIIVLACAVHRAGLHGPTVSLSIALISKMYHSQMEPAGVCERWRSVKLEASISGENQTLAGHSGRRSE